MVKLIQIADIRKDIKEKDSDIRASLALRWLIESNLSKTETRVYEQVVLAPDIITSREIADRLNLRINRIGNVLARLRRLGLIKSEAKTGPDGLYYEWSKTDG